MPTVSIGRDRLFQALGRTYHKYDLLCLVGLVQALRIFSGLDPIPTYTVTNVSRESMLKMRVKPEYYSFCADIYDSPFGRVCCFKRRRTLVAIGTHDLDTIEGLFTYEALPPSDINFVPLKQVKRFRADELMEFYKSDLKLKKFLHIIEDSPVFPVLYDRSRTVVSLPPISNGSHSAITLKTKNVFVYCTATDLTKAKIVLNTMVTMFSVYCERKFEIEPVEVIHSNGKSYVYPDLSPYHMEVSLSYITGIVGVSLEANEVAALLNKMQLYTKQSVSGDKKCNFIVSVPPTSGDVLHPCDVAEIAMNGYTEVLTWILYSYKENFSMLNRKDDRSTAVIIGNPHYSDFERAVHLEFEDLKKWFMDAS